ncbi:MAG: hypothetical protein AAF493_29815 [Pseudomonadota bacterium]
MAKPPPVEPTADDSAFARDVSNSLDETTDRLDLKTRTALAKARHAASEAAAQSRTTAFGWSRWALAAGLIVGLVVVYVGPSGQPPVPIADDVIELEILAVDESFDVYRDLEFYQWLHLDGRRG